MEERTRYYDVPESQKKEANEKIKALDIQINEITKIAKELLKNKEKEKKELEEIKDIIHREGIAAAKTRRQGGNRKKTKRYRVKKS